MMVTVRRILLFFSLSLSICNANERNISEIHKDINAVYNLLHPLSNLSPALIKSHHFLKRCVLLESHTTVSSFLSGEFRALTGEQNILIQSPCLGPDSLGNYLGSYFESITCAHLSRMHYVSVAKVYEPKSKHMATPFLLHLPDYIEYRDQKSDFRAQELALNKIMDLSMGQRNKFVSGEEGQQASPGERFRSAERIHAALKQHCPCPKSCHERKNAAWVKGLDIIRHIFREALLHHFRVAGEQSTTIGMIL
jgi:hypothetical protein